MKRSEFINAVLNSWDNTVFTTKEQIEAALDMFEKLGMIPPETKALPSDFTNIDFTQEFLDEHDFFVNRWDNE
jgi:hypothetical protein